VDPFTRRALPPTIATCLATAWLIVYDQVALAVIVGVVVAFLVIIQIPREKMLDVALCVVILALIAYPTALYTGTKAGGPLLGYSILVAVALLYAQRGKITIPNGTVLLLLFIVVTASADPAESTVRKFAFPAILALICYVAAAHADPKTILRFVVYVALGEVAIAILQSRGSLNLPWESLAPGYGTGVFENEILTGHLRTPGTFGHPLPLSFLFVIAIGILARGKDLFAARTRALYGALIITGCLLAGARSSLIIIAVALVFFAGTQRHAGTRFAKGAYFTAWALLAAVTVGAFQSSVVQKLLHSGSVSHREGAYASIPHLFNRQGNTQILIGNGWLGTIKLFERGLLQTDGFKAVDNQFVTLLVTSGLVGLLLFAGVAYRSLRWADPVTRLPVLCGLGMFAIFDVLLWQSTFVLLVAMMGLAAGSRLRTPAASRAAPPDWALGRSGRLPRPVVPLGSAERDPSHRSASPSP
jgi:hypothetical protein